MEEGNQATLTRHQLTPPIIAGKREMEDEANIGNKVLTHQLNFSWKVKQGHTQPPFAPIHPPGGQNSSLMFTVSYLTSPMNR